MSYREVNDLRKSGQLEEATAMAERDLEQRRDVWSCRALFWCLHDKAKQQSGDELRETTEQLRDLIQEMNDDDVAVSCLQRIETRLTPYANEVFKAEEESKTPANAHKAYCTILKIYNEGALNESLYTKFAWVIYRTLHADESGNVEYRKSLIEVYKKLNLQGASVLHSLILGEAVRVEKEWPLMFMFTEFIAWWGLENLTDDDWKQFETENGNKIMSRAEKMIYLYTKEVQSVEGLEPDEKFMQVLDKAIRKWPKDDNLLRCKALLLTKLGRKEEALSIYKKTLELTTGQKYYLWNELAHLVDDTELKIGLLSRALMLRVQEEFLGKIRAQLAGLLYELKRYPNALHEINLIEETYIKNNWNIPPQVRNIKQCIPADTKAEENGPLYARWAITADEFLYADIPSVYMVKVAHKEEVEKKNDGRTHKVIKWTLIDSDGKVAGIKPRKYNLQKANLGACFEVKRVDGKIIVIKPTDEQNVNWRKTVEGEISITSKKDGSTFGFVDNCYVPGNLLGKIKHGEHTKGIAIKQETKWRCVYINKG